MDKVTRPFYRPGLKLPGAAGKPKMVNQTALTTLESLISRHAGTGVIQDTNAANDYELAIHKILDPIIDKMLLKIDNVKEMKTVEQYCAHFGGRKSIDYLSRLKDLRTHNKIP